MTLTDWCCKVRSRSELVARLAALALGGIGAPAVAAEKPFLVVVHAAAPVEDLSVEELRRVFLLQRGFWKAGRPIRLVMPPIGQRTRSFMLERLCRKTEGELQRVILGSIYRGEIDQPPKAAANEEQALTLVASTENSIALVSGDLPLPPGAKAIRIDGKLPSEPGYPLVP